MLCKDVMDVIEAAYPREYALDWDNVGLLVGRDDKEVRRIYIALDATDEVIDAAIESQADMLVTHHPMIFGALKRINNLDFIGSRILKLIQSDISTMQCIRTTTCWEWPGCQERRCIFLRQRFWKPPARMDLRITARRGSGEWQIWIVRLPCGNAARR